VLAQRHWEKRRESWAFGVPSRFGVDLRSVREKVREKRQRLRANQKKEKKGESRRGRAPVKKRTMMSGCQMQRTEGKHWIRDVWKRGKDSLLDIKGSRTKRRNGGKEKRGRNLGGESPRENSPPLYVDIPPTAERPSRTTKVGKKIERNRKGGE